MHRRPPPQFHLARLSLLVPIIVLGAALVILRDRSRAFARRAELHRSLMETELARPPDVGPFAAGPDLAVGPVRFETRITVPAAPGPAPRRADPSARAVPLGSSAAASAARHAEMARRLDYAAAHPWLAAPE